MGALNINVHVRLLLHIVGHKTRVYIYLLPPFNYFTWITLMSLKFSSLRIMVLVPILSSLTSSYLSGLILLGRKTQVLLSWLQHTASCIMYPGQLIPTADLTRDGNKILKFNSDRSPTIIVYLNNCVCLSVT